MKEDYSDYHWLMTQHSGGGLSGMSNEQWNELDSRNKKHKLSRFRYAEFPYYSTIQKFVGDILATGEFISGPGDRHDDDSGVANDRQLYGDELTVSNMSDESNDENNGGNVHLSAAQKRAKLINDAMKSSRKHAENDEKMRLRKKNSASIESIANSISNLVQIMAAKNNVHHVLMEAEEKEDV
ncbi:hypothetical protein LEN26_001902 [Aphanomyces euteiches]|nr:hypothetical protein LEN26_001902 [Aphanomyces euteiches]